MRLVGNIKPLQLSNVWPGSDGIGTFEHNGDIYKIGGWNTNFPAPYTNSRVDVLKRNTNQWYRLSDAPFAGRHTFPIVKLGNFVYVVGGDANSGYYQKDFWRGELLPWGIRWVCIQPISAPFAEGRVGQICFAYQGKLVLVGGQIIDGGLPSLPPSAYSTKTGSPYYDDMWTYTPGDADFVKIADDCGYAPFSFMLGSPVKDNHMWLVGGGAYEVPARGQPRLYGKRVMKGTLDGWTLVSADAGLPQIMYNSVVTYGDDLVTLFGWNGANTTNVYASPTGENFRKIGNNVMQARHASSAVVSKKEILVLGGPLTETTVWALS